MNHANRKLPFIGHSSSEQYRKFASWMTSRRIRKTAEGLVKRVYTIAQTRLVEQKQKRCGLIAPRCIPSFGKIPLFGTPLESQNFPTARSSSGLKRYFTTFSTPRSLRGTTNRDFPKQPSNKHVFVMAQTSQNAPQANTALPASQEMGEPVTTETR